MQEALNHQDKDTSSGPELRRAADESFCSSCGKLIKQEAVVCVHCGVQVRELARIDQMPDVTGHSLAVSAGSGASVAAPPPTVAPEAYYLRSKDKTAAVLLAVFLSFWTWCYTYRRDAAKFWVGLTLSVVGLLMLGLPGLVVWVWAIIDATRRPDVFYNRYPTVVA